MSALDTLVEALQVPDVNFDAWADEEDIARIRPASDFQAEVMAAALNPETILGTTLPWTKTHADIRIRPGELSLWAGVNGHGKSMLLQQVVQHLAYHDELSCIASLEMKPHRTLFRSARQAVGVDQPSVRYLKRYFRWLKHRMWLYDQTGTVKPKRMIGVARYCAIQLGCHHVVIDSLLKCGLAEDDYNGQKQFIDNLASLARDTNTHVHVVVHARKGDESKPATKFDVRGSGAITDLADNVFVVWRNKRKELESRKPNPDPKVMERSDALLICDKQRHGESEGTYGLWFHHASQQFTERQGQRMALLGNELDRMTDEEEAQV